MSDCNVGPGDIVNIKDFCVDKEYIDASLLSKECFVSPNWIVKLGETYQAGNIVVVDIDENGPIFGIIDVIFINDENGHIIFFLC